MAKDIDLRLKLAADQAQKALKDTAKEAGKLADEFDESESAGKRMARAMGNVADDIEKELAQAQSAAERLAQALGPEFVAKTDGSVGGIVADLNKAGLTFQDIEQDADDLAAAIKRIDTVQGGLDQGSLNGFRQGLRDTAGEADNTRSVVANFAGNAAQELPGLAGAMGPLNMAMGQFAEYGAEGNISLKNFAAAGVGLAATGFVVSKISGHFAKIAAAKAFRKDQVQSYTEELREADTVLGAIKSKLEDDREVKVGTLGGIKDILPLLTEAGVAMDEWTAAISGNEEAQARLAERVDASTLSEREQGEVLVGMAGEVANVASATNRATQEQEFFEGATKKSTRATEDQVDAYQSAADAAERQRDAMADLHSQMLANIDKGYAHAQAQRDAADAVEAMNEVLADQESTERDVANAIDDARLAAIDQAAAYAEANGQALDSAGGINAMVSSLQAQADKLAPGSPLRVALDAYIAQLMAIPRNVNTTLSIEGGRDNHSSPGTFRQRARGGPISAGETYLVGEEGPELFTSDRSGQIVSNDKLSAGGGATYIINTGLDERKVIEIIKRYQKRGGQL